VFVWIFHRTSGVLLIFLLGLQLFTGFYQASASSSETVRMIAALHKHAALTCLTVILCIFHALYGIRTILIDLGIKHEKPLFWFCTGLGAILSIVFLVLFVLYVPS
jgi:succinate dehydrogenase cytochrome b556 subunit